MATVAGALKQTRLGISGRVGGWIFYGVPLVAFLVLILPRLFLNPGFFLQILVFGVTDGAVLALIALGYTMVYGIIELINFAHGDIFTLGGFIGVLIFSLIGIVPGKDLNLGFLTLFVVIGVMAVTMAINGGINVLIERVAYRPLRHQPRLAPLITAVGMSFILEGLMFIWKGPNFIQSPDLLPGGHFTVLAANVDYRSIVLIAAALVLVVLLTVFIERTKLGKAMRATAQDRDAAQLMGIDINRTISATFFIGAALAAAGGILYGFYLHNFRFDTGFITGLFAFTAAVLGGIGNIRGAALGALLIGLIRAFNDGYGRSEWSDVLIFAILVYVLVFRPTGLLGMQVPEK